MSSLKNKTILMGTHIPDCKVECKCEMNFDHEINIYQDISFVLPVIEVYKYKNKYIEKLLFNVICLYDSYFLIPLHCYEVLCALSNDVNRIVMIKNGNRETWLNLRDYELIKTADFSYKERGRLDLCILKHNINLDICCLFVPYTPRTSTEMQIVINPFFILQLNNYLKRIDVDVKTNMRSHAFFSGMISPSYEFKCITKMTDYVSYTAALRPNIYSNVMLNMTILQGMSGSLVIDLKSKIFKLNEIYNGKSTYSKNGLDVIIVVGKNTGISLNSERVINAITQVLNQEKLSAVS